MMYTRRGRLRVAAPNFNLGATWLASANRQPAWAMDQWKAGRLADIETGDLFNVVRVSDVQTGRAALADLWQADVPVGPVLHNRADQCIEFLVTTRAATQWDMPQTRLIGRPAYERDPLSVAMPAPGMQRLGGRSWLVLPDGERRPTDPADLAVALRRAGARLRHGHP
ncbi:hypothetical protein ACIQOV_03970 [Kitasatospora sp. NPDC091257]|uniref:hypothetical protein n=1 Tax=Kitasatospora sp. NPDC091257 TaxID=3364084 RepID=UPI003818E126